MSNSFYTHGSFPSTGSAATSASMRAELDLITAGFDKLPALSSGVANQLVAINSSGTGLTTITTLPTLTVNDSAFTVQDNADNTRKFKFEASGITAGATRTFTMPDATTTLVGTDTTQTLTNKTLTSPTISSPTITGTISAANLTLTGNTTLGDTTADSVTINGLLSSNLLFVDNTYDIGAVGANRPRNLYLSGSATVNGNVTLGDASSDAVTVNGTITSNLIFTDNTYDIGASGATRPRNLFLAGNATVAGNTTIGDADTDTITQAASYVTGTQLKSAKTATNTLSLAAYDVDGTAYTNLITLTASNTPTLALTSTGVGTINNMSIGATTASTGAFTTLSSTGNTTLGDASTDTVTVNGYMGVGGTPSAARSVYVQSTALTGTTQIGVDSRPVFTSGATSAGYGIISSSATAAASFTQGNLYGIGVFDATKGAGSTITNQFGIRIFDQTQGNTNYGLFADVSSGTNKFNIYASGTAANYFAGNVGIGVTPTYVLDVQTSSTSSVARVQNTTASSAAISVLHNSSSAGFNSAVYGSTYASGTVFSVGASGAALYTTNAGPFAIGTYGVAQPLTFSTNSSERMRIDSSGNVGIGTSSPFAKLSVQNPNTGDTGISLQRTGSARFDIVTGIAAVTGDALQINDSAANNYLTLRSGNVGIGTSAPNKTSISRALTVNGSSNAGLELAASDVCYGLVFANSSRFTLDTNNSGANIINFYTSGAERMRIDSAGNVGIGRVPTASDTWAGGSAIPILDIAKSAGFPVILSKGYSTTANQGGILVLAHSKSATVGTQTATANGDTFGSISFEGVNSSSAAASGGYIQAIQDSTAGATYIPSALTFYTGTNALAPAERLRIDSAGNMGLGVTPSAWSVKALQVSSTSLSSDSNDAYLTANGFFDGSWKYINTDFATQYYQVSGTHVWRYAASGTAGNAISFTTAMAITSSGNVGIGYAGGSYRLGVSGAIIAFDSAAGTPTTILAGNGGNQAVDRGVAIDFQSPGTGLGVNGTRTTARLISASSFASTQGAYLRFDTENTSGTITERMRITSGGDLLYGKTTSNTNAAGIEMAGGSNVGAMAMAYAGRLLYMNRLSTDGDLIEFAQANTTEGSISVSGTTVSYNGGHLSRYAQTQGTKDESLVKGTVLSNLDEMNVYVAPTTYWAEEDELPEGVSVGDVKVETHSVNNEQLNKVKVSDVEGDANVAGVFVNWSHDNAHNVDEINMAMTGDMIIRIAQGTTVQRGDLLMSAGDGTAKPQGDDIVRSKTVAKVTSTHVTCTYADGSYCVPCVLMAC